MIDNEIKLLSFQPFSLYANGGGSRILRRLYQGHESQVSSLVVEAYDTVQPKGIIPEKTVTTFLPIRSWQRSFLRHIFTYLRERTFKGFTFKRIAKSVDPSSYNILHVVNHGIFSTALCSEKFLKGKQLWVSFHDHYSTSGSNFEEANLLWNNSDRRFVISSEMGLQYKKLFGEKLFEVMTDGVSEDEISCPMEEHPNPCVIYFSGLLHIDYLPLFKVLADVLDSLTQQGFAFKLLLRGTYKVGFLSNRLFDVEYKPFSTSNTELKEELDSASILYLPIKFTVPDFYRYSLSTKMVGYFGAAGKILYHGPPDSAACNLLESSNSAKCCKSMNTGELEATIKLLINDNTVSKNAKSLAKNSFSLSGIQNRFWATSSN